MVKAKPVQLKYRPILCELKDQGLKDEILSIRTGRSLEKIKLIKNKGKRHGKSNRGPGWPIVGGNRSGFY